MSDESQEGAADPQEPWEIRDVDDVRHQLDVLRGLDRQRRAEQPGSPAYEAAAREAERLSRVLMDRIRTDDPATPLPPEGDGAHEGESTRED
jgi:hypothetical protein